MKQSVGPARPRADGAVNFKTAVNPAKASRRSRECLVFAENHYFAEIYAVLEESAGAWPGQGFWSFCLQKDIKKHPIIFLKKNNQDTKHHSQSNTSQMVNPDKHSHKGINYIYTTD